MRKRNQKGWRISNFALLLVVFKWHHGGEGVTNMENQNQSKAWRVLLACLKQNLSGGDSVALVTDPPASPPPPSASSWDQRQKWTLTKSGINIGLVPCVSCRSSFEFLMVLDTIQCYRKLKWMDRTHPAFEIVFILRWFCAGDGWDSLHPGVMYSSWGDSVRVTDEIVFILEWCIHPEVILCGWRDVQIQELTYWRQAFVSYFVEIQTHKRFKGTFIHYDTDTLSANFRGNPRNKGSFEPFMCLDLVLER